MYENTLRESVPLKEWDANERPREKLLKNGKGALSNRELLAVLIGTGSSKLNVVGVCNQILDYVNNDIVQLGKLSLRDFQKFDGVGEVKALILIAALELGRRRQAENVSEIKQIKASQDVFRLFLQDLSDLNHEEFWVLYLNRGNKVIGREKVSSGGLTGTVADSRIILKHALERLACSIILVHNHPSGNLNPSKSDLELTRKISKACALLDIKVLDHLILAGTGYISFADEGLMEEV